MVWRRVGFFHILSNRTEILQRCRWEIMRNQAKLEPVGKVFTAGFDR